MIAKTRAHDLLTPAERGQNVSGSAAGARSLHHAGLALLLVITLVGGMTAGNLFSRSNIPAVSSSLAGNSETARAFYDAMNQALAGGSTGALEALLAPGFRDHDASIGEAQSAEAFLERIRTFGATPGFALLSVESIEVSSNSLIVHVSQAKPVPREFAGISVEQSKDRPIFEVLRVTQEKVIDRWTPGIERLGATEFDDIAVRAPGLTDLATTLRRIEIPAGVVHRLSSNGTGFLLIESGSARVHTVHLSGDEETVQLGLGSAISAKPGDHIELRSVDGKPVTALNYTVKRRGATELIRLASALPAQSEAVTQSLLWSGPLPRAEGGTEHRLGRLVLPVGEEVRLTGVTNAALVLAIDSGEIEVVAPESAMSVLGEDFWPVEYANFASIDAQHAASLTGASEITLRNVSEDPVTIALVVLKGEAQSESPNGSNPGPRGRA